MLYTNRVVGVMAKERTRILVRDNKGKLRRLLNIVYEDDGSIYFIFRKKDKFVITKNKEVEYSDYNGHRTINLDKVLNVCTNPKFSFHPGKKVIHLMSENRDNFGEDYRLFNSYNLDGKEAYYIFQIIFPNDLDTLDEFKKKVNDNCYIINEGDYSEEESICIEIIVHTDSIEPNDIRVLPKSENRRVTDYTIYNNTFGYTCSLFFSGFRNNNEDRSILITVNTLEKYICYVLGLYED